MRRGGWRSHSLHWEFSFYFYALIASSSRLTIYLDGFFYSTSFGEDIVVDSPSA